jgi:hypothetical protein
MILGKYEILPFARHIIVQRDRITKTTVSKILSSWLRVVKRWVVSNWLLVIVFSCLTAYLVLPSTLSSISDLVFPPGIGPHQSTAKVSFTVSGDTSYPGTVNLNITVTNNDIIPHDYAILALIGNNALTEWYGPGWYRDSLAPATDIQNVPGPWYDQAFITAGSLNPGQSFQVTRRIEIVNDPRIRDALVLVYDKHDVSKELARRTQFDVINNGG